MSASEVIEQIKALPREEQRAVAAYLKSIEASEPVSGVRYISSERAEELSAKIFEENAELFRKLAQ